MLPAGATLLVIGWLLIHAVWQGLVTWAVVSVARRYTEQPETRRRIGNVGLAIFALVQMATLAIVWQHLAAPTGFSDSVDERPDLTTDILRNGLIRPIPLPGSSWIAPVADGVRQWSSMIAWVWTIALTLLVGRTLLLLYVLRRDLRRTRPLDSATSFRFALLAKKIGVRGKVRFAESAQTTVPATAGVRPAVVVIPAKKVLDIPSAHIDAIVLHELAHVRQHDFLLNVGREILGAIYIWHPGIHRLRRQIEDDGEEAADAIAAEVYGNRAEYADALLTLAERRLDKPLALGATGGSSLRRRMQLVLKGGSRARAPRDAATAIATICGLLLMLLAFGRVLGTEARLQKDREWIAARSLPEVVVQTLSHDRPNPLFDAALFDAVRGLRSKGTVDGILLDKLTDATLIAVPSTWCYDQLCARRLAGGTRDFGDFGNANEQAAIVQALCADTTQERRVRAGIVLAAVSSVSDNCCAVRLIIRQRSTAKMFSRAPNEYFRLELADAAFGERTQRISKILSGFQHAVAPSDPEVDAIWRDLRVLPSLEAVVATDFAVLQRLALIRRDDKLPLSLRGMRLTRAI